jgi:hypothetical protein
MASYGFVYVINHDHMPDVYKIGYTDRAPMQRLQELSSSTSVPPGFNLVFYGEFQNAQSVESNLHEQLSSHRIHESREFFEFDKTFVTRNLFDWFKKAALNVSICNEFYNIVAFIDEEANQEAESSDESETFDDDVVIASAQVIENAKDGF